MNVNLDDYDVRHSQTGAIRLKIPRSVFPTMMMALSHWIERYIAGIEFIVLTWADADDELEELKQAKESAENLRKEIFDKLDGIVWYVDLNGKAWPTESPAALRELDKSKEVLWACGSDKLLADIIEFGLECPMANMTNMATEELTDWVHELKDGEHKF